LIDDEGYKTVKMCTGVTATGVPVTCEESKTVDEAGGRDVADIVTVSPDGSETVNATGVVSERDWTPIPFDRFASAT